MVLDEEEAEKKNHGHSIGDGSELQFAILIIYVYKGMSLSALGNKWF